MTPTPKEKLQELEHSLKHHDWFANRSEMYSVVLRARSRWHQINIQMEELEELGYGDEVQELYIKYRPF